MVNDPSTMIFRLRLSMSMDILAPTARAIGRKKIHKRLEVR